MNNKLNYRPDIDGLRAIAVISVIIFHMNSKWLPGGFVGVDIFFVISGYLITSIIYQEMKDNNFSFQNFYSRRIRRIFPVFFVILIVSLFFGAIVMPPNIYYGFTNSAFSSLFSFANMYFAKAGGYFDNPDTFPLLHTWSLSVEEQYYLFWPMILLILFKFNIKYKKMLSILILTMLMSFIFAQILTKSYSSWAFYLLPARTGELLIGSILALIHTENGTYKKYTNLGSFIGIILIIFSFIFINKNSVFPGINAFWPTLGAGLIIYGNQNSFVNKLLSLKPIVYIGLISYSLYLWHWPVLAFSRYCYPSELSFKLLLLLAVLIIILSVFTYHFIEKPTRRIKLAFQQTFKYYAVIPASLIILIFVISHITKGIPSRFESVNDVSIEKLSSTIAERTCFNTLNPVCTINESKNKKAQSILVHGDSHVGQFETFFSKITDKDEDIVFHFLDSDSCIVAKDIKTIGPDFQKKCYKNRALFNQKIDKYNTIIIAGRWEYAIYNNKINKGSSDTKYLNELNNFIKNLSKKGKNIIIISQVPKYDINVNKNELLNKLFRYKIKYQVDKNYLNANKQVKNIIKKYKNVYFLDLDDFYCSKGICSPYDENGILMYRDENHLNIHGAEVLADRFLHSDKYNWFKNILSGKNK